MGNCVNKKKIFNPGAVLDRVIAGSGPEDECLLYKLANFKKGVRSSESQILFSLLRVNWLRPSQELLGSMELRLRAEARRRWRSWSRTSSAAWCTTGWVLGDLESLWFKALGSRGADYKDWVPSLEISQQWQGIQSTINHQWKGNQSNLACHTSLLSG